VTLALLGAGTFYEGGWYGRAKGFYKRTESEVRIKRAMPLLTNPSAESPPPQAIKRQFLLVTYGTDLLGVETIEKIEVKPIEIPAGANESIAIVLKPEGGAPGTSKRQRLLPVEVRVVNRDDPAKTWTTGPVTSGPLAYTSPTISEVSDVKNGDLISWRVPGLSGGSFQWWATGPSGSRKDAPSSVTGNEWKLEDPLDWLPGKWRIHCRYTPSGGAATEFDFEQNLGYRSPDITVIGWIDGAQIQLPDGTSTVKILAPNIFGQIQDVNSAESIGFIMGSIATRGPFLLSIANDGIFAGSTAPYPRYKVGPLAPDPARTYLNAHLLKFSPNDAPPAEFLKQWPGLEGRKMVNETTLSEFRDNPINFRSFHRFQAKFELDDSGKIKGTPIYKDVGPRTKVGKTPIDWMPEWAEPIGETGPHDGTLNTTGASVQFNPKNGKTHSAKLADDFEQYTQGRISTIGKLSGGQVNKQINNLKVAWIWSIIEFGAANAKTGSTAVPEHEIFPVYHVYYNGKRIDTLSNSISDARLEEFIQMGEAP
jgi:hypothetical protein